MWNEMSWDRMPGTGTEVPTIGEFLAGNPVPHLVPHDMSVTLGVPSGGSRALDPRYPHRPPLVLTESLSRLIWRGEREVNVRVPCSLLFARA